MNSLGGTRLTIRIPVIAKCGPSCLDGGVENLSDGLGQSLPVLDREPTRQSRRADASQEERFIRIDVANTGQESLVQE
jgi:hypothetical protein